MVQTVNNQKQIFLAALNMAGDGFDAANPKLGWPGDLATGDEPVSSLSQYIRRLEELGYIKRADVGKMFAAPGIPAYPGTGDFTGANSAFKIYKVRQADVANVIFSATRNYTFGRGLDPKAAPYGDKGFAIIRKGGDAIPYYNKQSALNRNLGFMPGSNTQESPGTETGDSILSM